MWTLTGVTFGDGGTAAGSFVYDASTNTYSSVNITTTTGSVRTGSSYHFIAPSPNSPSSSFVLYVSVGAGNLTGTPAFSMVFPFPGLTNSSGVIPVEFGIEAVCSDAVCTGPVEPTRFLTGGSVVGSPPTSVPTLSGYGILTLAVLMAGVAAAALRPLGPHAA